ncbi:hypermethylated in cancer 1 protein-like isoform X2 [Sinocyclocheilus rhinocerous]|uniref:Hypermethylated in cancer 1 protein n=2 Tax=Sinocyclocheilus rhinocerous TaxID=307959 RepID=A0A673GT35_9TELE|nr:PREDICTED: hypermethylated in cancer 1 protein-like isoform X2 [Sinocyclocheilus rhinocerous]XP_016414109.1 PREDICTED: hypermethylated in cancer 1 protein-like isoform X2 [Sinocyclocheilus rhinocerous]
MLDAMEVQSHAKHLLLQLNTQRTKGFLCDVIIVVQNALFRAHKNILAASSLYLKSLVVHDNLINLDHEMVSPGVFRVILDYIYTGRLSEGDPTSPTEPNIGAVLAAASYLQLLDLVTLCKKKLKRNGKYHLRPNPGFLPYKIDYSGMGGGRIRISTPVIHSCHPGGVVSTPRPTPLEDLAPLPLAPHVGELHAPAPTQGPPPYPPAKTSLTPQSGLRLTDRSCSSVYGLDLSKKSPSSQSQLPSGHPHLISSLHPEEEPEGELDQSTGPLLSPNDGSRKMETAHHVGSLTPHPFHLPNHPLAPHLPHLHRLQGQEPYPCPPSPEPMEDSREQGQDGSNIYRWVKNEPSNPEDEDEEDEEDENGGIGEQDKERHQHMNHHKNSEEKLNMNERGYDRGTCDDGEDDNGTGSEETGSSEGRPSPPVPGGRYHMPYEPESFGDNLYVCIPCDKGFPSSEQLNAHVETHTEEELNNGIELDNNSKPTNAHGPTSLNSSSGLHSPFLDSKSTQNFLSIGLGEIIRPYRCSSCDKSYKDPATLRQHEKTHWLTRPYPCSICGKKFTQRGTMTRHMRSHLGLKPFACDACGMRFTRQYRLTEHMRIHSGEKPYVCQVCGGKFAQQRNLISHMKMHSSGTGGGGLTPDGKLKIDFSEGIYPLSKYAAEHLGLKQEKISDLLTASQHLLVDIKAMESLYPLSKLAVEHLGLTHNKMDVLNQPLPPTSQQLSAESRTIDRYSPS